MFQMCLKRLRHLYSWFCGNCKTFITLMFVIAMTTESPMARAEQEHGSTHTMRPKLRNLEHPANIMDDFVQYHQGMKLFLHVNEITRNLGVTTKQFSNETFFLNILVSGGWILRNAQACANICIASNGKIFTLTNLSGTNSTDDCTLKEYKPTHGSEVFIRDQNSTHIFALGIKYLGGKHMPVVEWIPKSAISESFRMSTRTIPQLEYERAILKEHRHFFYDAQKRERTCKKTKISLNNFKSQLHSCNDKTCRRQVRQNCKHTHGNDRCGNIFSTLVPICNKLKEPEQRKNCRREKRHQCKLEAQKVNQWLSSEQVKHICMHKVGLLQKCMNKIKFLQLEDFRKEMKRCRKEAETQSW